MKSIEAKTVLGMLKKVYEQEAEPEEALEALEPFMDLEGMDELYDEEDEDGQ